MIEWLAMGGYGFYVWSSYAMLAIAVIVELVWLRRHRRESLRRVAEMRAERSMAGATRPGEANR
ncbi:MAG: heme exporter protein CcmD [Burkholderiaceae bacterium]